MSKNPNKQILKTVTEVVKQKAPLYPYYPVSAKYEQDGNFFIFSVQYPSGVACITFFMIKKDLSKKNGITSIQLAGINDKSAISVIKIIDFKYKQTTSNIWGLQGTILVGYREGHLVILRFRDKKSQVMHKFNRLFKKQGMMSRATSFLASQEAYKTLIQGPIKTAIYCPSRKYGVSFLVGNTLVLYKNKQQTCQQLLQKQYKALLMQQSKSCSIVLNQGILFRVQNTQICTYNYTQKQQIIVAYSMQSLISCYSSKDFTILYSIRMKMPIRKINSYSFPEGQFMTILPYEDYVIIVNLTKGQYTKVIGHRCFTANSVIYKNQLNSLIYLSGGMDHRICFDKLEDIKIWNSLIPSKASQKDGKIQSSKMALEIDQDQHGVQFSNKYSLGLYQNARTNSHDYGFSDLLMGLNLIACPTYDGKIKVFSINYK